MVNNGSIGKNLTSHDLRLTKKAEPPPTRDANRDSGTESANGGWLRRLVRHQRHTCSLCPQPSRSPPNGVARAVKVVSQIVMSRKTGCICRRTVACQQARCGAKATLTVQSRSVINLAKASACCCSIKIKLAYIGLNVGVSGASSSVVVSMMPNEKS